MADEQTAIKIIANASLRKKMVDWVVVFLWVCFISQLLMACFDLSMSSSDFLFPSAILAMFLIFALMLFIGLFWTGCDGFYHRHIHRPASLINRHMSIGFSVYILDLCWPPMASGRDIGLIIACFIVAGIIASVIVYLIAYLIQNVMIIYAIPRFVYRMRRKTQSDVEQPADEKGESATPASRKAFPSEASSVASAQGFASGSERTRWQPGSELPEPSRATPEQTEEQEPATTRRRECLKWAYGHVALIFCWFTLVFITIPLRFTVQSEALLGIALLFTIWMTTLALQEALQRGQPFLKRRWVRNTCVVALNPVLFTALGLIACVYAEVHLTGRPIEAVLASYQRKTTYTDLLRKHPLPSFAAGDIAQAYLNAGLVTWGFKLWEHRRQLLSGGGLTICVVSVVAALLNITCGPLLAASLGIGGPSRDLAFAARTATLAMGGPALGRIGGDQGLNAAMVVANGILTQMALGLGAGQWLDDAVLWLKRHVGIFRDRARRDAGTASSGQTAAPRQEEDGPKRGRTVASPSTVAVGALVGISGAAMGTAHLYEARSDAAPYSTLAMTAFGVSVMICSLIEPLTCWLIGMIAANTA